MTAPAATRHRRRSIARSSCITVWAFAFVLLVKAAVPLMATASAALQGLGVAEVCDVYGVATIPLDANGQPLAPTAPMDHSMHGGHASMASMDPMDHGMRGDPASMAMPAQPATAQGDARADSGPPAHHHDAGHGTHGDHCALTAVVALAASATSAPGTTLSTRIVVLDGTAIEPASRIDATALWARQLEHGPPAIG